MSALPDEVKTFIVQQLACFDAPSTVVAAVKDEFGVSVTRQAVEAYDPNKVQGQRLSDEYRAVFTATRERFLADQASIGVSHRMVRLRRLQRLADKAEAMGNMALVASLLEQSARECGDAFTNKRQNEVSGKDGASLLSGGIAVTFIDGPGKPS